MNNEKIEIKIQPKSKYYFDLIKKKLISIIKPILVILLLIATVYISFYILLFIIFLTGFNYFLKIIRK